MAARRRVSTFRTKIREELICAICLDFLHEPKILNCAHSFCQNCLTSIVLTSSSYKYGLGGNLSRHDDLECPSCREVTNIPEGRVCQLKTNWNLKTLVDIVSEDEKQRTRDAVRTRRNTRRSVRSQGNPGCDLHHRQLEYYCLECCELLCPKCIGAGHRGHDFKDADEALQEQIDAVHSLIQPACEVAAKAETTLGDLYEERDVLRQNAYDVTDGIKSFFDKARKALDQRERALLSTTRKYIDLKLSNLDAHYEMLEQHRNAILHQVAVVEKLIEDNDSVALLRQKKSVSEELEVHEQSVMSLYDMITKSKKACLLFCEDQDVIQKICVTGTISECSPDPQSRSFCMKRIMVSEEDDPYLIVPLRFEDIESEFPQEEMRFQDSLSSEYQSGTKADLVSGVSNIIPTLDEVPLAPPRSCSISVSDPAVSLVGKNFPVPNSKQTSMQSRKATVYSKSSLLDNGSHSVPLHTSHKRRLPQCDVPKLATLPPQRLSVGEDRHSGSDEDYEPVEDIVPPTPAPRTIPPPLPRNHPDIPVHRKRADEIRMNTKPVPKPRKRSGTALTDRTTTGPQNIRRRSNTLPERLEAISSVQRHELILPIIVITSDKLCCPSNPDLVYPVGVCCFRDTLVVTDVYNHCLRIMDQNGTFIKKIGKEGRSGGQFKEPSAVAVDASSHIYITERDNPRVQKFTTGGKYVSKFGHKTLLGSQLADPMGIAISPDGCIVVSDWDKGSILFFATNGKLVNTLPKNDGVKFPAGIVFDKEGHLLVADRGSHCVWMVSKSGEIIRRIGAMGTGFGQLYFPYGVVVKDNQVLVSESGNNRVSIFTLSGDFVRCFGEYGSEPGMFDHPRHMCINRKGQLFVADEMNQRIQAFQL